MTETTIFAVATPPGRSGVAVIRISGPNARFALETMAGAVTEPRRSVLRRLNARNGECLDEALVTFFPGPRSFTGEDSAEFHVHGSSAVIAGILSELSSLPGLQPAERGAFTRRAVENGRMDLTAAEGLADLIAAETAAQRRQAFAQAGGALMRAAQGWRARLLVCMAMTEAEIDFSEEEDVSHGLERAWPDIEAVIGEIEAALRSAAHGERLREGVRFVIAGPPNVGKSSLVNALAQRDVAIVTPVAGTTRDLIEVHLDLGGYPVTVIDTAGLRETEDVVEAIGVERSRRAVEGADALLWLSDQDGVLPDAPTGPIRVAVRTKADLLDSIPQQSGALFISAATGFGLDRLLDRMTSIARDVAEGSEPALVTRARHRVELGSVVEHLKRALSVESEAAELFAEDLRLALSAIGRLTGAVDMDEVYDVIFSTFCIGK